MLDRNAFQRTVSIVRRQDQSDHWRQMRPARAKLSVARPMERAVGQLLRHSDFAAGLNAATVSSWPALFV